MKVHKLDSELPDLSLVTIEDCLDMREKKGMAAVIAGAWLERFMGESGGIDKIRAEF